MYLNLTSFLVVSLLLGCAGLSERTTKSSALGNVEFTRTLTTGPLPSVIVSNNVVRVAAPVESEKIVSTAAQNYSADVKKSLPLGTKLILLGVGILILLLVGWVVLRSSAAARAIASTLDSGVAEAIRRLRSKSSLSTDPARTAELNIEIAELEGLRGRLRK